VLEDHLLAVVIERRQPLVEPIRTLGLLAGATAAALWRLRLVVGVFSNKDLEGIAEGLAPLADEAYACATGSVRARSPAEVAEAFSRRGIPTRAFADVREALEAVRSDAGETDLILVTGSLYTVADARRALVAGSPPETRGPGPAEEEP